jgi:hypothetical protein
VQGQYIVGTKGQTLVEQNASAVPTCKQSAFVFVVRVRLQWNLKSGTPNIPGRDFFPVKAVLRIEFTAREVLAGGKIVLFVKASNRIHYPWHFRIWVRDSEMGRFAARDSNFRAQILAGSAVPGLQAGHPSKGRPSIGGH